MKTHALTDDEKSIVLAALTKAANAGAPCPTNLMLSPLVGRSTTGVGLLVAKLEADRLIKVERTGSSRRVTIVATGRSTLLSVKSAKARGRRTADAYKRPGRAETVPIGKLSDSELEARLVDSRTCGRCGARVAAGCEHVRPATSFAIGASA